VTTPSRIEEILHEMEQDPELARALRDTILGQEISMLPAAVAQNQGLIIRLMERQVELASAVNTALDAVVSAMSQAGENTARALEAHGQRIEGVESALAELREEGQKTRESLGQMLLDVKQVQSDMAETKANVKQLQSDMTEVKTDVKQVQSDMAETKANVKQLQSDMTEVKTDVKQLQSDMAETRTDVRRIDGRLDRGFGANYEAKVAQNVRSILGQQAGVRSSRVLKGPSLRTDPDFDQQVESAEASGAITEDESDELLLLDLIVSGTRRGNPERVYAGIEVSITANDDDVNRAADRAQILRKVTGGPVMAVVIADRVEAQQRELAARREVAVAVHPE
jgi:septal ring factor EnvC (AmiA/AmiB activator)